TASGAEAVAEIFADITADRVMAARKVLALLRAHPDAQPLADAARRMVFLKGRDSHDYKFSSAVLEDHQRLSPLARDRLLAASVFYFKGAGDKDNDLVKRTRSAFAG